MGADHPLEVVRNVRFWAPYLSVPLPRITVVKVVARPSFEEVVQALDGHHQRLRAASAAMLETIAYLDSAESWGDDESSLSCFLAGRYGVGSGTAWEWVRVARALRRLPVIREAYSSGELSWDQLRPLTRFATPETDERLAVDAPGMRVGQLWRESRRHERARKSHLSDRQCRSLRMDWDEAKQNLHVEGDLPGEQGAAFEAAVTKRAEQVEVEADVFDRKAARLADALTELVTSAGGEAKPATLVIHADAGIVLGDGPELAAAAALSTPALAETESGVQLPDEAVRRLACDASVEWIAERDGRAVGIGRQRRLIPGWMKRQLGFRDPECRFDGCSRKMNLVAHHIVPWARGGPTDLDNLVRLCGTHHRMVHERGWRITGHPDRRLRFHDPGRRGPPRSRAPSLAAAALA